MKTVFADSFYSFALANPNAPAHARAVAFVKTFTGKIVTTGWVLTELADGWAKPIQRTFLVPLLAKIASESERSNRILHGSAFARRHRPLSRSP